MSLLLAHIHMHTVHTVCTVCTYYCQPLYIMTTPLVVFLYTGVQLDLFTTPSMVVIPYTSIQPDLYVYKITHGSIFFAGTEAQFQKARAGLGYVRLTVHVCR